MINRFAGFAPRISHSALTSHSLSESENQFADRVCICKKNFLIIFLLLCNLFPTCCWSYSTFFVKIYICQTWNNQAFPFAFPSFLALSRHTSHCDIQPDSDQNHRQQQGHSKNVTFIVEFSQNSHILRSINKFDVFITAITCLVFFRGDVRIEPKKETITFKKPKFSEFSVRK